MLKKFKLEKVFDVKGKKILITGSTGQIGHILCKTFTNLGAEVIGIDIKLNKKLMIKDKNIKYFVTDIRNKKSLSNTFNKIYKQYSTIDVLINNAGASCFEDFEKRSEKNLDWVMDVNLKGTFFCIQQFVKNYRKTKCASIINIASVYGLISPDFRIYQKGDRKNSEIYGATKAGIIQMTKYFGTHLANRKIRVNAISPGGILDISKPQNKKFIKKYSYRNPMNRIGKYEDIIGAAIYLASSASEYVTGQNIVVDGGMSSW